VPFTVEPTDLPEVLVLRPRLYGDERGWFAEIAQVGAFEALGGGLPTSFVQVNQSRSLRGVVRGLHFQWDPPQGKLMRVVIIICSSFCGVTSGLSLKSVMW